MEVVKQTVSLWKTWTYDTHHTDTHTPPMVTKTVNRWPDHWLSVLQMVGDFYLMFSFFLKTGEVPWAPLLQRLRKYLVTSPLPVLRTCPGLPPGWLEGQIRMQDLCPSKVRGCPATPSGEQSFRDSAFHCFSSHVIINHKAEINNRNVGYHTLNSHRVPKGLGRCWARHLLAGCREGARRSPHPEREGWSLLGSTHKRASGCPSASRRLAAGR